MVVYPTGKPEENSPDKEYTMATRQQVSSSLRQLFILQPDRLELTAWAGSGVLYSTTRPAAEMKTLEQQ